MTRSFGPTSGWCSAAVLAAAAAGCTTDPRDPAPVAPAELTAVPDVATADDAARAARHIAFTPCTEDPELECGELAVPVDYGAPRGEQVVLATVRARAFTAHKQGVIFVNPGGPGGSGVDLVIRAKLLFDRLRQRFDIVSFDPRGTARSQLVDCTVELPAQPADGSLEALAGFLDETSGRYARACRDQHGALATRIGTNNVARDMDVFRAALHERELNYLGFSYGTALGSSYATLFPDRVRAMVLDGNVTPAWFTDYLLELDADGSAGAELALRRIDQLCGAAPGCPLGPAGVVATYDRVVARLDRDPVMVDGAAITGASVTQRVFPLLYNERLGWPAIIEVLARADAGDYSLLPPLPTDTSPTVTIPSTFAIVCSDSPTRRPGLDYLPAQTANRQLYPRFGSVNFGLAITACTGWPRTPVVPLANLATDHPIVLIGNDFDPATPIAWSRTMATALGAKARLIRYQGGGHTIYGSGSACVDGAVEAYFRDLTPPAKGFTCPAQALSLAGNRRAASAAPVMADILRQIAPVLPTLPGRSRSTR